GDRVSFHDLSVARAEVIHQPTGHTRVEPLRGGVSVEGVSRVGRVAGAVVRRAGGRDVHLRPDGCGAVLGGIAARAGRVDSGDGVVIGGSVNRRRVGV